MIGHFIDSRPGTLLMAAIIGAIWGVIVAILVAMSLALTTGLGFNPQLRAFLFAGAVAGLLWVLLPEIRRTAVWQVLVGAAFLLLILGGSGGAPFTVPLAQSLPYLAALALSIFGVLWACQSSLSPVLLGGMNRFRREQALMLTLRGLGFVFFAVIVALPLFVLIMTSFKSQQALLANPLNLMPEWDKGIHGIFRSYIELFRDFNFGRYLWNSTLVSTLTVFLTLTFAIPGAYAVSRLNFPGRAAMSRSILMIYLVPAIVLVIPLYTVFSQIGLRDNLWGLLVVYPATTLPVALYMLQGYFRGIPQELEEAGMMDGCSRLRVIWSITLPLSLPALASVGLYVFMIAWNEFLFAFMFLDDPNMFTLSRGIVSLNSSEVPRQHLMAGAVVSTVPIVLIFLYAERFMVKGLTSGGVKG